MVKGLYTAYTGMLNQQNKVDVIANNLANAATTGFKKEGSTSEAFDAVLAYKIKDQTSAFRGKKIGTMNLGVKIGENYVDYSQGAFETTNNTYDLALSGKGFFCVEFTNKSGETSTKYTRDGSFTLNVDGYLVTKDGDYVLDEEGKHIKLDPLSDARIDENGTIFQNDQRVTTIGLEDFEDYNYLEHYGENYYQPVEGATMTEASAKVFEGYLEASNVQVVSEMVELISATRTYESNQKVIQTIDETLDKAVNQLGKV
ncbi:MAG: flagellar basal-body rod protein FlgF [Lachnospiraceae bacterium]|nr:flagellar basal-body rod protein FlgF [Lachnospiraceae bacterium]